MLFQSWWRPKYWLAFGSSIWLPGLKCCMVAKYWTGFGVTQPWLVRTSRLVPLKLLVSEQSPMPRNRSNPQRMTFCFPGLIHILPAVFSISQWFNITDYCEYQLLSIILSINFSDSTTDSTEHVWSNLIQLDPSWVSLKLLVVSSCQCASHVEPLLQRSKGLHVATVARPLRPCLNTWWEMLRWLMVIM